MTTREKIIVGMMCLTIVYGAYEVVGSRVSKGTISTVQKNPIGELKAFVAEIGSKLNQEQTTKTYAYAIEKAEAAWNKDPFIQSSRPLKKRLAATPAIQATKSAERRSKFIYSGFLQLGDTRMAIINGTEYAVGDALPDRSFYVKSIAPSSVVIGKVKDPETIQLPIEEFDSGLAE
jgi:hypothetical protein